MVDTVVPGPIAAAAFYVVRQPINGQLGIVEGGKLSADGGVSPVAEVLFLCRPPNRESTITSAELLQL